MVRSIFHKRPGMQAGLSTRHAGAMQSSSMMPFVFLNALPDVAQHFVGWFWLQMHAELMISDNCQQWLEDLFPGQWQPVPGSALAWIIFLYTCYLRLIHAEAPVPTLCLSLDCPEVRSIRRPDDFVHTSFCRSWMKMMNKTDLGTHPLLPPLHPSICCLAFNLLSVQKWTLPPNPVLGLFNDT